MQNTEEKTVAQQVNQSNTVQQISYSEEVWKKLHEFSESLKKLEHMMINNLSNEAGITRMKLTEAWHWASLAFSAHATSQLKADTMIAPAQPSTAPIAPAEINTNDQVSTIAKN